MVKNYTLHLILGQLELPHFALMQDDLVIRFRRHDPMP